MSNIFSLCDDKIMHCHMNKIIDTFSNANDLFYQREATALFKTS